MNDRGTPGRGLRFEKDALQENPSMTCGQNGGVDKPPLRKSMSKGLLISANSKHGKPILQY